MTDLAPEEQLAVARMLWPEEKGALRVFEHYEGCSTLQCWSAPFWRDIDLSSDEAVGRMVECLRKHDVRRLRGWAADCYGGDDGNETAKDLAALARACLAVGGEG